VPGNRGRTHDDELGTAGKDEACAAEVTKRRTGMANRGDGRLRRKSTRRVHLPDAVPVVPLPEWAVGTASGRTLPSAQTPPPENRGAPDCQERSAKTFPLISKSFRGSQSSFPSALAGVRPPEREPVGRALSPKGIRSAPKAGPRLSGKAVFLCSRERMF
jgi:hypothetical protein